jgi:hypothetical protein
MMTDSYQKTFGEIRAPEGLRARIAQIPQQQAQAVPRPRHLPRAAVLAAVLALAAGTVAAAGEAVVHLRADQEGRYEILTRETVCPEDFSREAREAAAAGETTAAFDTWGEGAAFLGLALDNPLEPVLEPAALQQVYPEELEAHCLLTLFEQEGVLTGGQLHALYQREDVMVSLTAEARIGGISRGYGYGSPVELETETWPMGDGGTASVAVTTWPDAGAWFARDGVLYQLTVLPGEGGTAARETLEQTLKELLALF